VISLVSSQAGVALVVNRTLSSLSENQTRAPLLHQLPSAMSGRSDNTLRVWVDKSVIEIFVGTHTILSTRVYPVAGDEADRVATVLSPGSGSGTSCGFAGPLESWEMENVYGDASELGH
jgi:sucrose-6-phosphate hydrolase SacC (GH32 family)